MTIQTRPNRQRHGILMPTMFFIVMTPPQPRERQTTKAREKALAAIEKCLNCHLAACDESKFRRK